MTDRATVTIGTPMTICPICGEYHTSFIDCKGTRPLPMPLLASTSTPFQSDLKILTMDEYNAIVDRLAALEAWKTQQESGK